VIHRTSHGAFGIDSVTLSEPTEADAQWSLLEFQAEHAGATFGPVHLAVTGEWMAHGTAESQ
jgi:hypothetical protein